MAESKVMVLVMVMVTVMVMVKTNGGDDLTRFPLPPLSFNLGLVNGSAALLGLAHQVSLAPSPSPSPSPGARAPPIFWKFTL